MRGAFTRRQIDADHAPILTPVRAVETVDSCDRKVIDGEGKRLIWCDAERMAKCRPDRAAMRDGDDIAPSMVCAEA